MIYSIYRTILQSLYFILLAYYLCIIIYFTLTWIPPLYRTRLFGFFRKITSPFMNLVSGKLVVGGRFDLGAMLGLILYYVLIQMLYNISLAV